MYPLRCKIGSTAPSPTGFKNLLLCQLVANGPVSDFIHHGMHWGVARGSQSLPAMKPYVLDHTLKPPLTFYEVTALIAPRPCVWEIGNKDKLISPKWADRALERMGRAYKALDAEKQFGVLTTV